MFFGNPLMLSTEDQTPALIPHATGLLKLHYDKACSISLASTMCQEVFHHRLSRVITSESVFMCMEEWPINGNTHTYIHTAQAGC